VVRLLETIALSCGKQEVRHPNPKAPFWRPLFGRIIGPVGPGILTIGAVIERRDLFVEREVRPIEHLKRIGRWEDIGSVEFPLRIEAFHYFTDFK